MEPDAWDDLEELYDTMNEAFRTFKRDHLDPRTRKRLEVDERFEWFVEIASKI